LQPTISVGTEPVLTVPALTIRRKAPIRICPIKALTGWRAEPGPQIKKQKHKMGASEDEIFFHTQPV
jgi:hypothetical protein